MSASTAFNVGLTMALTGFGFVLLVWALDKRFLVGAAVVCFVLGAIAFWGAWIGHYRGGEKTAAQTTTQPVTLRADPQIVVSARSVQAYKDASGQIHFGRDINQDNSYVVLVTFRNEPTRERESRDATVSASVSFRNITPLGTAFWVGSDSATVDLKVHTEQSIALAHVVPWTPMAVRTGSAANGYASLIRDDRSTPRREITYITALTNLGRAQPGTPEGTETLTVTLAEAGRVLGEATIEIRFHGASAPDVKLVGWLPVAQGASNPVARPRVSVRFEWQRHGLNGCYEPFVVKNDSEVPAQRIQIAEIANGSRVATFDAIPYLGAHDEVKIWPRIEDVETRGGHPDLARFMEVVRIGRLWDFRRAQGTGANIKEEFARGATVPLLITYRDLDGREWRTRGSLTMGGPWGDGIVAETAGFE